MDNGFVSLMRESPEKEDSGRWNRFFSFGGDPPTGWLPDATSLPLNPLCTAVAFVPYTTAFSYTNDIQEQQCVEVYLGLCRGVNAEGELRYI